MNGATRILAIESHLGLTPTSPNNTTSHTGCSNNSNNNNNSNSTTHAAGSASFNDALKDKIVSNIVEHIVPKMTAIVAEAVGEAVDAANIRPSVPIRSSAMLSSSSRSNTVDQVQTSCPNQNEQILPSVNRSLSLSPSTPSKLPIVITSEDLGTCDKQLASPPKKRKKVPTATAAVSGVRSTTTSDTGVTTSSKTKLTSGPSSTKTPMLRIFVRTFKPEKQTITLDVKPSDRIESVKAKIPFFGYYPLPHFSFKGEFLVSENLE